MIANRFVGHAAGFYNFVAASSGKKTAGVWHVSSALHGDGWAPEIAIPFKTLGLKGADDRVDQDQL